jgi:hypothetical protein
VKFSIPILILVAMSSLFTAWGQLRPPNEVGATMGQVHALVRDMDGAKKFFTILGGTPARVGGVDAMKFPGVLILLQEGNPSNGSEGSPVDHIGFWVSDGPGVVAKLKTLGIKMDADAGVKKPGLKNVGNVYTNDGLKVEILEDKEQTATNPTVFDHLHHFLPENAAPDARAWYIKTFGAMALPGNAINSQFAGTRQVFGKAKEPISPTKGRAIDYVGVEIKGLKEFCKKLEASRTKLDQPYSKSRHKGYASAMITDPWGLSIELTEGLDKF